MRFGRTKEQAREDWRRYMHAKNMGHDRFAWIPVQLHDGTWLWWERYVSAVDAWSSDRKTVRFLPGSVELEIHRGWAKRFAERHYGW